MRRVPCQSLALVIATAAVMAIPRLALGHGDESIKPGELLTAWEFEPAIVIPLLLSAWLYTQGLWRLWRGGNIGRGIRVWQAACFAGGWMTLVAALVSPLHPWGQVLFSVHMIQHELLMLVAAPLMVLGQPLVVTLKALPPQWANELARRGNSQFWQTGWRLLTNAMVAWMLHAIVLWTWHAPALMDAVIENEWVHALQHLSFFLSALLFWWAVIYGRQRGLGYGMAILYMFTTALHSGLLGVLMTFATSLWYPPYAHTTQPWGLSPLEDQQLGGMIMWIPAGVVYIVAGIALMAAWMRESETRLRKREKIANRSAGLAIKMIVLVVPLSVISGCERPDHQTARAQTGGDEQEGHKKIAYYGCTSCHVIPGTAGADARVGPPLDHVGSRAYIGVGLRNNPQNLIAWIQRPRDIEPKAAMPNLHLSDADARDIACYLLTLR